MGKEEIRKSFRELYPNGDQSLLLREYYKKKKKELIVTACLGVVLLVFTAYSDYGNSRLEQGSRLYRSENGEGSQEVALEVKKEEGSWESITLTLEEKEYKPEELEEKYEQVVELLPELILGENESLDRVSEDLEFVQEIEGYPFFLSWKSSDSQILDYEGRIVKEDRKEDMLLEIQVTISYREWSREHLFYINLTASRDKGFLSSLKDYVKKEEEGSRTSQVFTLPLSYQSEELSWRLPNPKSSLLVGVLFTILLPILSFQKDREIYKQAEARKEELEKEYADFISTLILYLDAGMSVRGSFFRISEDYTKRKKKTGETNYLYEEILNICRQMKNGLSEKKAYEALGKRCALPCYKKLMALLTQHMERGSYHLLESMRKEIENANETGYKRVKKQGEEMGTKLLLPMMLMLGIVMILIMVPACFSFQM